jgi:hypothetical protein
VAETDFLLLRWRKAIPDIAGIAGSPWQDATLADDSENVAFADDQQIFII